MGGNQLKSYLLLILSGEKLNLIKLYWMNIEDAWSPFKDSKINTIIN